jgi:hypothetical protein
VQTRSHSPACVPQAVNQALRQKERLLNATETADVFLNADDFRVNEDGTLSQHLFEESIAQPAQSAARTDRSQLRFWMSQADPFRRRFGDLSRSDSWVGLKTNDYRCFVRNPVKRKAGVPLPPSHQSLANVGTGRRGLRRGLKSETCSSWSGFREVFMQLTRAVWN